MCGIVAATAKRDVVPILIAGLKALEYRGYDSAGLAVLEPGALKRLRAKGKVRDLEALQATDPIGGTTGTEVIAHLVHLGLDRGLSLREATRLAVNRLHGAYAIAVLSQREPGHVVGARRGSPLVVGVGEGEHFLGSDVQALIRETRRFVHLEEGDLVEITRDGFEVFDLEGRPLVRPVRTTDLSADAVERGEYRHYMLKEIHEQPEAVARTLEGRIAGNRVLPNIFGVDADALLGKVRNIHIVACGTSYHAGLVARYWFEGMAGIPCVVEVASEYRYRQGVVPARCSSPSRSRVRRPTRWPRCARARPAGTSGRSRSATFLNPPWCASATWC
jgi:glucosamine--fructose-6-phosphate aminotransferase (isomerizing)